MHTCKPTAMITFDCPFLGLYGSTPGSTSCTSSSKIAYPFKVLDCEHPSIQAELCSTHFLNDIPSILFLSLVRTTLQCSLDLCLDLLPKLRDELDVHIGFQKCGANLF